MSNNLSSIKWPFWVNSLISENKNTAYPGNTKWGSITVLLTSCLTGLESAAWQLTIFVFICKTDESKPVKQEVNGTAILPPLIFPGLSYSCLLSKELSSLLVAMGFILKCAKIKKAFAVSNKVWIITGLRYRMINWKLCCNCVFWAIFLSVMPNSFLVLVASNARMSW